MADEQKKYVDLAGLKVYHGEVKKLIDEKEQVGVAATKVKELADGQVATNTKAIATAEGHIGDLEGLSTSTKTNTVSAINEVYAAVAAGGTAAVLTIEETISGDSAKEYIFKQGNVRIGTVTVPEDLVVSRGEVVTDPEGQDPGTYLVLTLSNATKDKVYINVGKLVDIYTAEAKATSVQLTITGREIHAEIVDKAVTTAKLADNAVTTDKVVNGNITKAKLAEAVQTSLDKADNADANAKQYADTAKSEAVAAAATDATAKANAAETNAKTAVTALANGQVATNTANITANTEAITALQNSVANVATDQDILALFN